MEKKIKKDRVSGHAPDSLDLLGPFLAGIPEAALLVGDNGAILLANGSFCALAGYSGYELVGKPLALLVPVRHRQRHETLMQSFLDREKGNIQVHKQVNLITASGQELPVDIRLRMMALAEESFVCATVRDVSEERKNTMLLEQDYAMQQVVTDVLKLSLESLNLEKQLEKILHRLLTMPPLAVLARGGIYTADEERGFFTLRAHAGFAEKDGKPCGRIYPGDGLCGKALEQRKLVYASCEQCETASSCDQPFKHAHYCVPIKIGRKVLGLINLYLTEEHQRDAAEERCLSMVADALAGVISHHQAEEEKWRLQRKLGESAKLAVLGRLAARFAHEIRNPLTAVGGFARRLQKNTLGNDKIKEYSNLMVAEVERLENVLLNLLTMSQPELGATQPHDINEIMEYLLTGFGDECRQKKIFLQSSLHELPLVPMNSRLVREAIENVISNAVDSMPQGGTLSVTTETYSQADQHYVLVTVGDTGQGISKERLPLIFEPFYTSKSANRRMGLGLASTKKIVEDHNGFIAIESEPGKGTTVRLAFSTHLQPVTDGARLEAVAEAVGESTCDRDLEVLKSAVDQASEAFIIMDAESRIVFFNVAAERLFGVGRQEVLGRDIAALIGEEMARQHKKAVAVFLHTGETRRSGTEREMVLHHRDGTPVTVSLSFSMSENRGRVYCTGLIRDLSEFKALQQKIINAERLAALGQTVAEISHEIRNPLIAIGGLAAQLKKQAADEKSLAKLQVIIYEVKRLENLLHGLKDLYTPRMLELSAFDVLELLREVRDQFSADLEEKHIQLVFVPAFGGTEVMADRQRLKQVLINVMKNGLEAMEKGGSLTLQVVSSPTTVEVLVKDSGTGIAPAAMEKIFEPFYTTKRQGTGLGLAVSKRIVEEHQGGVFLLNSKEGQGTEVRISLPRIA